MSGGLLIDLDGTLVDTAPDLARAMNRVLADLDLPPADPADVRALTGRGARALITRGVALAAPDFAYDAHDAVRRFLAYYAAEIAVESRPFPGVPETLKALRAAGWGLAVCTNKPEGLARALLDALDLTALFDAVIGGDTTPAAKPDPRPVHAAAAAIGARQAGFIGDSAVDVAAARAAGLRVAVARYGYGDGPAESMGADAVFDSFTEIPALAPGLARSPTAAATD